MSSGIVIDRPNGIALFQYKAQRSAIKLEKIGLKHSRGSVRKHVALMLGLKATAKCDVVIEALDVKIKELEALGDLGIREI